jgi:hypothetical protein
VTWANLGGPKVTCSGDSRLMNKYRLLSLFLIPRKLLLKFAQGKLLQLKDLRPNQIELFLLHIRNPSMELRRMQI